ncbi:Transketolase domain protein [Oscillochloris trichoides DG-6]|uniref:Transketolase domain protein n=1 Tax=Oscillochloris trichoides DG-6 TaxID=765420 RepID=E1IFJ0_9CHLR|nr:alpha-ketoacid dehydrogenase subunit beta [Oscillochloris trichoides]EFO80006.1 Transketolase domain protein [Oscillochloris trichoides DG-6]
MTWDQGLHKTISTIGDGNGREMTYLEAIRDAMRYELQRDPRVLLLGEDIGVYGGAFKVTQGLIEEFGAQRVIDTPMAELCMISVATGMAFQGFLPVVEMQFADFISTGFDSIVQFAATNHYRWGQAVPITIRAPGGGGLRAGPFHSQSNEAWFAHVPGLKVVAPATPADARGLLISAIRDPNPVIYYETKALYRSLKGAVPTGEEGIVPIGQAAQRQVGEELTIITYAAMVVEALHAAQQLQVEGRSIEVLDLRTIRPLDTEAILASVRKTGKVLIVHEANRTGGVGGEVAALIAEHAFEYLDGPITRLAAPDTPVPYSPPLEDAYRPNAAKILAAARQLLAY